MVGENNPVSDYIDFAKKVLSIPQAHEMMAKYTVLDKEAKNLKKKLKADDRQVIVTTIWVADPGAGRVAYTGPHPDAPWGRHARRHPPDRGPHPHPVVGPGRGGRAGRTGRPVGHPAQGP